MAHCCPTLHVLDNSCTLFTASAGISSTVEAACTSVVSSETTVGYPVISRSCPMKWLRPLVQHVRLEMVTSEPITLW